MNKTMKGIERDSSIFRNVKASWGWWEPNISKDLVNITPEPQTEHTLEERGQILFGKCIVGSDVVPALRETV